MNHDETIKFVQKRIHEYVDKIESEHGKLTAAAVMLVNSYDTAVKDGAFLSVNYALLLRMAITQNIIAAGIDGAKVIDLSNDFNAMMKQLQKELQVNENESQESAANEVVH